MRLATAAAVPQEYSRGYLARLFGRIDTAVNRVSSHLAVVKTASFSVSDGDFWYVCNGGASITVTLPNAATYDGPPINLSTIAAFTVVSASSNVVPLAGGAAGTAILAATAGKWATLVSDGTNWRIMQGN